MDETGFSVRRLPSDQEAEFKHVQQEEGHARAATRDERDLAYFGKKQRLRRNFGFISVVGLTCTLMITWQGVLITFQEEFQNGGPEGQICGFLFAWVGVTSQTLVMAELGSMIPLAGGQYNWVSILAPKSCSRFLSYLTGWITTIAWQAVTAGGVYLSGSMIQGLVVLNYPGYSPTTWQTTLMFYAVILIGLTINTLLARTLPYFESVVLIIHVLGFFGLLVPLVYLAPKGNAADVFQTWLNEGDWDSRGVTWLVGATTAMFSFIGIDGASHMAEEIEGAANVMPKAMLLGCLINGATGFSMLIAVLFCLGDIDAALNTPTGYPYMEIFAQGVGSNSGATGMIVICILAMIFATIGFLATSSRMLWAFARERAVPGHRWLSKASLMNNINIHDKTALPLVSIAVCVVVNVLLALINIGSTAAFNAFTSLSVAAFYSSYTIAASVMLYRRLTHSTSSLRWGPFRLGRAGTPVLIFSIAYSVLAWFFSFWPQSSSVTPQNMNWSVVVYFGVLVFALIYWFAVARHVYTGSIVEVTLEDVLNLEQIELKEDIK